MTLDPHPGFFRRRMVAGGPWVPVKFFMGPPLDPITGEEMDRSWRLRCEVNGEKFDRNHKEFDPNDEWIRCYGHEIDAETYNYMVSVREWANAYAPNEPEARPLRTIDPRLAAPVMPPRRL